MDLLVEGNPWRHDIQKREREGEGEKKKKSDNTGVRNKQRGPFTVEGRSLRIAHWQR